MSRPKFNPTPLQRRQVEKLTRAGHKAAFVADLLEISETILTRDFAHELAFAHSNLKLDLLSTLYRKAQRGHVGACVALLRATWVSEGSADRIAAARAASAPKESAPNLATQKKFGGFFL